MEKINWKQKLTSRKFWAAVVGFVTAILVAFGFGDNDVTQITGIIMAGATLIAYIIGEGLVDAQREKAKSGDTFVSHYYAAPGETEKATEGDTEGETGA